MRTAKDWKEFEVIDTSSGEKLERWGDVILARPDPQVIWNTPKGEDWKRANAHYRRSTSGGGHWEVKNMPREQWVIHYKELSFKISPTGFKHTGLFPEQAVNWDFMADKIRRAGRPVKVLNLFAYTGGATLACAQAGAQVCHVDASKGMVSWARENAQLSGLQDKPIRWIVDDCKKFVEREIRRGNRYDGVVMDPPSYGRGPGGAVGRPAVFPAQLLHHRPFSVGHAVHFRGDGGEALSGQALFLGDWPAGDQERLCTALWQHRHLGAAA